MELSFVYNAACQKSTSLNMTKKLKPKGKFIG